MATDINQEHEDSLNVLDRVALFITKIVGTMYCAIVFTVIALISLPDAIKGGTPTLIQWIAQTFLQLVLLSVIMVGQNLQSKHAEKVADATYETALKIEKLLDQKDGLTAEKEV